MRRQTLGFFFFSMALGLFFKNMPLIDGGAVFEYIKNKKQIYETGEDGHCTTLLTLSVADGIGSSEFIAYYISNILALQSTVTLLDFVESKEKFGNLKAEEIQKTIVQAIQKEMEIYRNFSIDAYNRLFKKYKNLSFCDKDDLINQSIICQSLAAVSTTLVSGVIDESNPERPQLLIHQKGDSRIAILRPHWNPDKSSFYYSMIFLSKEMQSKFNAPYQFSPFGDLNDFRNNFLRRIPIQAGDIVLIGSDGFFDNLHPSIITYAANYFAKALLISAELSFEIEIKDEAEKVGQKYAEVFEAKKKKPKIEPKPADKKKGKIFDRIMDNLFSCCKSEDMLKEPEIIVEGPINELDEHALINIPKLSIPKPLIKNKNRFFSCLPLDMVQFSQDPKSFQINYSECVKFSLQDEFEFTKQNLETLKQNFSPKIFAEGLKNLALYLSNKEKDYPSPYYIGNFFDVFNISSYNLALKFPNKFGKPDDITIVSGMIAESLPERPETQEISIFKEEIIKRKNYFYTLLDADIENFIKEFENEAYKPKPRPIETNDVHFFI